MNLAMALCIHNYMQMPFTIECDSHVDRMSLCFCPNSSLPLTVWCCVIRIADYRCTCRLMEGWVKEAMKLGQSAGSKGCDDAFSKGGFKWHKSGKFNYIIP